MKIIEIKNGVAKVKAGNRVGYVDNCEYNQIGDKVPEFRCVDKADEAYAELEAKFDGN